MQEADSLYHEACSAETFDQERASAAQEHYQRAMKRIHYIGIMLQGRTPDDEEITIITKTTDWTGRRFAGYQRRNGRISGRVFP